MSHINQAGTATYDKIIQKVQDYTLYNHMLKQHLRMIKDNYGDNGCVFVYKGFPLSFMQQVQQVFASASQPNIVLLDGRLNLEAIKANPLAYITAIQQVAENHAAMWYEEFIIFSRNINPALLQPKQFVIME